MKKTWICLLLAMLMALSCIAMAEEPVGAEPVDAAVADAGEVALDLPDDGFMDQPFAGEGSIAAEAGYLEAAEGAAAAPNAVAIDLSQGSDFYVGIPAQLNAVLDPADAQTTFTWKSSKKKVARVSAAGILTPLKAGKTKITVKTANKKKNTVAVTVRKNAVKLNTMPTKAQIKMFKNSWYLYPLSIQRDAKGNYILKICLINGLGNSKRITNLGLQMYVGDEMIAEKRWSKIRVSSRKGTAKAFKVKFKASELKNANPLLLPSYTGNIKFVMSVKPTLVYTK